MSISAVKKPHIRYPQNGYILTLIFGIFACIALIVFAIKLI